MNRRICAALCCVLFFGCVATAWGAAAPRVTPRVVRVGFFAFDGYHVMDRDGRKSGYGYDYLQHMAIYNNWAYEYVGYDKGWGQMPKMLADGQIDLVTSARKTPERERQFAFSDRPLGTSSTIVTARAGNTRYPAGQYDAWDGIRVGMLTGSSRNDGFDRFARERGFRYVPVPYDTTEAMLRDLHHGDAVDAVVTSNLRSTYREWILAQFDPLPFYVMLRKEDTALLAEVNNALQRLSVDAGNLDVQLSREYYAVDSGGEVPFTAAERAFIEQARKDGTVFRAVLNPDREPYSYRRDGAYQGLLRDLAQVIFRRAGLAVDIVDLPTREAYRQAVKDPATDIHLDSWRLFSLAEADGYKATAPYLTETITLVRLKTHQDRPLHSLAAATASDPTQYVTQHHAASVPITRYPSVEAALEAVRGERQDGMYLYSLAAERLLAKEATNDLVSEVVRDSAGQFCMAIRRELDARVGVILNKAILSLTPEDIAQIAAPYRTHAVEFSLKGFVYDNPVLAILAVAAFFSLNIVTLLYMVERSRRRREHAQAEEDKRKRQALQDALDAARRAGIAREAFMSRISHEIRTPLNAITGYMAIAAAADALSRVRDCVEKTQSAARHLSGLINDMLDIAAIENGHMKIVAEPFDLKSLMFSLARMFAPQAQAGGVRLIFLPRGVTEEHLVGDRLRLNQILMNLLANAVKFTPRGGRIVLTVAQTVLTEKTVHIRFAVEDTGIGMSEDFLERLWKPFEQEDDSTSRRVGGTGLGLSIARNLVAMMHGAITVKSARNEGSIFTVELPFGRHTDRPAPGDGPLDFSGVRALVVDDDTENGAHIRQILTRCGVESVAAHSGEEAVSAVEAAPFDLCILDWHVPGMDCLETVRRIRARHADMAIIVTGYDYTAIQEEARAAGVTRCVPKPLFQSTLFDLLASHYGAVRTAPRDAARPDHAALKGMRLLVAEDNDMNMEILRTVLGKYGLVTDGAVNGREALDRFLQSPPGTYRAILMDIQMPVMDGLEATRAIRAANHPDAAAVPIVAMTANAFPEDVSASLAAGMNDHLAKPIDFEKLLTRLEDFM